MDVLSAWEFHAVKHMSDFMPEFLPVEVFAGEITLHCHTTNLSLDVYEWKGYLL